ncbi:MAG: TIM barrel protein [Thalassolituus sp.]
MKLTANLSLLYTEMHLSDRFAAAAADGFTAVEIQFPYELPAEVIRTQLNKHSLRCILINVPAGDLMTGGRGLACVPGKEAEFAAAVEQAAEYARLLKPECINVLAGRTGDDQPEECLQVLRNNLRQAADVLNPLGVTVTVEAINTFDMPGFLISDFQSMHALVSEFDPDSVRMQFDIYHMARMAEPVEQLIKEYGQKIGHIQFADVPGRHEPGTGDLDFLALFRAIRSSGYAGWSGAEYRPQGKSTSEGLAWMRALQKRSN